MKCEYCPALYTDGYEYPETYCAVYPDSECIEFKDGSLGCRHKRKTIETRLAVREDIEDHFYDGYEEWYRNEQKIETAVKEAVLKACKTENIIFACADIDGNLYKANMNDEIPSHLHDFCFRIREYLEECGYEIKER